MDWGDLICLGSLVLVLGVVALVTERHRWRIIDYIWQKVHHPNQKPPKPLQFWNRTARYLVIIVVIGLGTVMLYGLVLAGHIIAASFVTVFMVLVLVVVIMVNSYWKDHFDL
jgi:cation transport ATPase